MENLGLGIELMLVGMASVFIILIIVILLGKLMIQLTNRFPAERQPEQKPTAQASEIDSETRSIIDAAVKEITGGRGTVRSVIKL